MQRMLDLRSPLRRSLHYFQPSPSGSIDSFKPVAVGFSFGWILFLSPGFVSHICFVPVSYLGLELLGRTFVSTILCWLVGRILIWLLMVNL
uniref:Uncharacterized protein n=1 Tax=Manihot esculenta TaxID=3983 RepID=A0A2C9V0W2_MANES